MVKQDDKLKNKFKGLRIMAGLSQEQVARHLNIDRSSFNRYENNPDTIKREMLKKLSYLYNCNVEDFFIDMSKNMEALAYDKNIS